MDEFAPAPTQRTSDDVGRTREESLAARKKVVKRVPVVSAQRPNPEPTVVPEPEADHQLDVLA